MWQGAVGVVPIDGLVSPAYVVAKPMKWTDSRYFNALFHTAEYMGEANKYSHGIVKDRNRLYWEDFKQMQSTFPPLKEQIIIADAIDKITIELEVGIRHIVNEISLLSEYRSRLISDVVTGKLDVRDIELPTTADTDLTEEYSDIQDAECAMEDQEMQEDITIVQEDDE
jgi:type I restriction enzyme S subunit